MTKFLTLEGFTPAVAANAEEALTPVMDGWAFRKAQRGDPGLAGIPVVVLSGADAELIPELEAAASFRKPVSFPEVIDAVRRLCDKE